MSATIALVHAAVERLLKAKRLVGDLRRVARTDFKPKLSANLRKLKDKVVAAYREAGFQPPEPASFANQAAATRPASRTCSTSVSRGLPGVPRRRRVSARKASRPTCAAASPSGWPAAPARPSPRSAICSAPTRKYAVPFCEYLDRVAVTRRDGDLRFLAEAQEIAP